MSGTTILDLEAELEPYTPEWRERELAKFVPLPPEHIEGYAVASPRIKIKARAYRGTTVLMAGGALIPIKWIEDLEQNQGYWSLPCCRHPENHELQAFYTSPEDQSKGIPDIYVFHCECGRRHRRFCVGGSKTRVQQPDGAWGWDVTHPRIKWEVR